MAVKGINDIIETMRAIFVTRELYTADGKLAEQRLSLVERIIFTACSTILLGVLGAGLAFVLRKP